MYACLFTFFMYSHHPVELLIDFPNIIFPNVSWQGNIGSIWGVRTPVKRLSLIPDDPGSRKNPALSLTFLPLWIDTAASGRWGGRNGFLQGRVARGCLMTRSPQVVVVGLGIGMTCGGLCKADFQAQEMVILYAWNWAKPWFLSGCLKWFWWQWYIITTRRISTPGAWSICTRKREGVKLSPSFSASSLARGGFRSLHNSMPGVSYGSAWGALLSSPRKGPSHLEHQRWFSLQAFLFSCGVSN